MKPNSPEAENRRSELRASARCLIANAKHEIGDKPKWATTGVECLIFSLFEDLEKALKREEQYARIIKKSCKPPKQKPCRACEQRKYKAKAVNRHRSRARPGNREEAKRIIEEIEECWPGFRKIPEKMWNLYVDSAPVCYCGRTVAPRIVSQSPKAQFCEANHRFNMANAKYRQKKTKYVQQRKALAEVL